jgi:hypothetical protein
VINFTALLELSRIQYFVTILLALMVYELEPFSASFHYDVVELVAR